MTYEQTIAYLFDSLPMFQRIGDAAIKKDLTNIKLLCDLMGDPHKSFNAIHIAGTNGKGSTSHMLASVFMASGRKVGLYTSPHYIDFRERIKVNGKMISEREVIHFVEKFKDEWITIKPSFFEITVAMAFYYFRMKKVDMAIIETGLGGRLDSTNIIYPLISVITNIGYDHMQMLGNTLPEIAQEKAGIIKPRIPIVIGEWNQNTAEVFKTKANQHLAPIYFASKHILLDKIGEKPEKSIFKVSTKKMNWPGRIVTDMTGPYQEKNIKTVIETCFVWNKHYAGEELTVQMIREGLKNVRISMNMIGRWMVIQDKPAVITDAAHNIDGMKMILPELLKMSFRKRHFVLGFVSDKDILKILSLFPKNAAYYWCRPDIPRGKSVLDTMALGLSLGLKGFPFDSIQLAYDNALSQAGKKDLIFVGGSSYVVGELLAGLNKKK